MRISDWSSDVCSSDLSKVQLANGVALGSRLSGIDTAISNTNAAIVNEQTARSTGDQANANAITVVSTKVNGHTSSISSLQSSVNRSEEHTSELQSLMRISYAVFCLKKKIKTII